MSPLPAPQENPDHRTGSPPHCGPRGMECPGGRPHCSGARFFGFSTDTGFVQCHDMDFVNFRIPRYANMQLNWWD